MRYFFAFLLGFALLSLTVFGIAGRRGTDFRKPPLEIFDDMVRQDKLRPQVPNSFFLDGRSSQAHLAGTVAQRIGDRNNDAWEGIPRNTGRVAGATLGRPGASDAAARTAGTGCRGAGDLVLPLVSVAPRA